MLKTTIKTKNKKKIDYKYPNFKDSKGRKSRKKLTVMGKTEKKQEKRSFKKGIDKKEILWYTLTPLNERNKRADPSNIRTPKVLK